MDVALTASGYTRDALWKGGKGLLSLADIFRVLSLGASPTDGTLGHPLTLVGLYRDDLKLLLEMTPSEAYQNFEHLDYNTLPAGMCMEFDTKRPLYDRITKIRYANPGDNEVCDGTVIYDVNDKNDNGWLVPQSKIFVAALDFYHIAAAFPILNAAFGLQLRTPDGTVVPIADAWKVVLKRPGGNEVKSFEALAAYIKNRCDANGGYLPLGYADTLPKRTLCSGPLCGQ